MVPGVAGRQGWRAQLSYDAAYAGEAVGNAVEHGGRDGLGSAITPADAAGTELWLSVTDTDGGSP